MFLSKVIAIISKAFKIVFSRKIYILISFFSSILLVVFSTWIGNFKLIYIILSSEIITLIEKLSIVFGLVASITTNFTLFAAFYTILVAILFSINLSMFLFFFNKKRVLLKKSGVVTLGGFFSGLFGVGCVACGSVILMPLLSFFGAGWVLFYMPFGGQEFGILAIVILFISIYMSAKKITEADVCGSFKS